MDIHDAIEQARNAQIDIDRATNELALTIRKLFLALVPDSATSEDKMRALEYLNDAAKEATATARQQAQDEVDQLSSLDQIPVPLSTGEAVRH